MLREVEIIGVKLPSANVQIRRHWSQNAASTKAIRERVDEALRAKFARVRLAIAGVPNALTVTVTRISPGELDPHDNLRVSAKAVVDAIAAWVGVDDKNRLYTWDYAHEKRGRGVYGVRIAIVDHETLEPVRAVVGMPVPVKPAPRKQGKSRGAVGQHALVFRPAWAALPWQQDPTSDEYQVVDVSKLVANLGEPEAFAVIDPRTGGQCRLWRREHNDPGLGGLVWLYEEDPGR